MNYVFIEHFQEIAQGHFTVRRLERVYGKDVVRAEYDRLAEAIEPVVFHQRPTTPNG